jgi:hypothetical protein
MIRAIEENPRITKMTSMVVAGAILIRNVVSDARKKIDSFRVNASPLNLFHIVIVQSLW